jgi:uncharacterized protein YjiS (DUF1127 family)
MRTRHIDRRDLGLLSGVRAGCADRDAVMGAVRAVRGWALERLRQEMRYQRSARVLRGLDDRTLADIGLVRSPIQGTVYELVAEEGGECPMLKAELAPARRLAWRRCAPALTATMRHAALIGLALVAALGRPVAATERWLPRVTDLPPGTVQVSPFIPGMGQHWAKPSDLPLGPIYCVMKGRVICVEFMVAQKDLMAGKSFERLRPGVEGRLPPVDHVELTHMPHGHEGFEVPHYDLHMYFVPPRARFDGLEGAP